MQNFDKSHRAHNTSVRIIDQSANRRWYVRSYTAMTYLFSLTLYIRSLWTCSCKLANPTEQISKKSQQKVQQYTKSFKIRDKCWLLALASSRVNVLSYKWLGPSLVRHMRFFHFFSVHCILLLILYVLIKIKSFLNNFSCQGVRCKVTATASVTVVGVVT